MAYMDEAAACGKQKYAIYFLIMHIILVPDLP
jgi:hypothetical protein